jgi:hypothetical protein
MDVIPFLKYLKLNAQLNTRLAQLNFEEALIIVDYKMRILPKSARETKADFYGKRGWTLHSVLVYTKNKENTNIEINVYDHWSDDTKQDAWFTASSLHAVLEVLDPKPKKITIVSDNGPHYHNTELMIILSFILFSYICIFSVIPILNLLANTCNKSSCKVWAYY